MKKKTEFIKNIPEDFVEIRLYDSFKRRSDCLSWKIPTGVIEELVKWWKEKKQNEVDCNRKEKRGQAQFSIYPDRSVQVEKLDNMGRPGCVGWHLSELVIHELVKWSEGRDLKNENICHQ